jgi:glycosyltransferase involved in cell wall biosynthesis
MANMANTDAGGLTVGYVASHHPAVSHTFVHNEVLALRRAGVDVRTLTVHRASSDDLLTDADRAADRETFAILPITPSRLLGCHLRSFQRSPIRYLGTLIRSQQACTPGLRGRLWQLFYFAEAIVLHEHCQHTGIRHLHAQFANVASDVAQIVTWRGGSGWSWSIALHGPVEFYDVQRSRLAQKIADATLVRTISHFGRSQVLAFANERHWGKVHMIRAGIDLSAYPVAPHPPNGELQILCVGRLISFKGQSLLIEAVCELARRGVKARAVLVGDGPTRASLARQARRAGVADRVELTGALGQDELPARYASAHVFCLPSLAEGLPVVLMEAMATGRPVVTTSIMGIGELVTDSVHGRLVAPGTVNQLADALAELAENEDVRKRMGEAGRRRVEEEYDVQRSAQLLSEMFASRLAPAR